MKLKAALFDLDDTLYTTWDDCDRAGSLAVGVYGERVLGIAPERMIAAFSQGRRIVMRSLPGAASGHDRALAAQRALEMLSLNPFLHAEAIHEAYWSAVLDTMRLCPEVPELFADLRHAGVCICVCTNMTAQIQMRKLVRLGLTKSVDFLVSSEEAGEDKPAPGVFRLGLQKAGALRQEACFIGDSFSHDVVGAHDEGIAALWINHAHLPCPDRTLDGFIETHSMAQAATVLRQRLKELSI